MGTTMEFRLLARDEWPLILPLVRQLNPDTDPGVLESRLREMMDQPYHCLGAFREEALVGICGFWITTRFYCGKQIELDNVVVLESERSRGTGRAMMAWIYRYAREIGCRTCELNAYVTNARSHKFYLNEGFAIVGYHFQKPLVSEGESESTSDS